jgi:hypothetical protein
VVDILDSALYGALLKHVAQVNEFVRDAIDAGGAALVHGNVGASREE